MDTKRGAIIVGASLAALTAGWFIRRWYAKNQHIQDLESEEEVRAFDEKMAEMNKPKKTHRSTNGRHRVATT
ncbi:MAG TPA: hypothetical protein VHE55_13795 [Fimbriimonadaceae bacterium]|nr:hypothetical protein [Fimbriimonadaceae bacterium]